MSDGKGVYRYVRDGNFDDEIEVRSKMIKSYCSVPEFQYDLPVLLVMKERVEEIIKLLEYGNEALEENGK